MNEKHVIGKNMLLDKNIAKDMFGEGEKVVTNDKVNDEILSKLFQNALKNEPIPESSHTELFGHNGSSYLENHKHAVSSRKTFKCSGVSEKEVVKETKTLNSKRLLSALISH